MTRVSSQVLDEFDRPVQGAQVYVLKIDGTQATLTLDGGGPLVQPINTDTFGSYYYNTADSIYRREIWYGGKKRWVEQLIDTPLDAALRTDLAASTGAGILGWIASGIGAVARTILDKLRDTPCIVDYGAIGNGVTLNDTAIAKAVAALGAAGGGDLLVPKGDFLISVAVQANQQGVRLRGANKKKSRLLQSTASQPVINVTADYCGVEHLCVDYSVTPTSGSTAAIIANGQHCNYRSIVIPNCYNGFKFTISPFQNATDIQVFNYVNAGFWLTAINDVFITHAKLDAGNATNGAKGGIWLQDRVEAFSFDNIEILNGVRPITTEAASNTAGNRPAYGNFSSVYFDSAAQDANFSVLVSTSFVAPWFSNGRTSTGFPGATFDAVDSIDIIAGRFFNSGSHGCSLTANAKRVNFTAPSFESNSVTAGSGVAHGLNIAAGATDFSVIGGRAHNGLSTGQQGYGINIAAGASDNYSIIGVNVNGNATGGISDGGSGTSKHIIANPGCRTRNRGIGTIASGASSIAVAHGLAFTPGQGDVIISSNVNLGAAGVTNIWCSAVDATNITVTSNVNATSNIGFTWDARKSA